MSTKASRGRMLLRAQRPGPPVGDPPARLTIEQKRAWSDIAKTCPDVLRRSDSIWLELCAGALAHWRAGYRGNVRLMYRWLGQGFMPMRARRRLLFPERMKP